MLRLSMSPLRQWEYSHAGVNHSMHIAWSVLKNLLTKEEKDEER